MTTRANAAIVALCASLSVAGGCGDPDGPDGPAGPIRVEPRNTAPVVNAGPDTLIQLPVNAVVLIGSAADAEGDIESYSWKKVNGPDTYSIGNPGAWTTDVTDMERGWYQFELTVRDEDGLSGRDSVAIVVYDPNVQRGDEVVFRDLRWSCPMGCNIQVANIRPYTTTGADISVFLQASDMAEWIPVTPTSEWTSQTRYLWSLSDNFVYVYTDDGSGTVNVKIVF